MKEKDRALVGDILGARVSSNPENYFGLPMMVGCNKKRAFAQYVDKIRKHLNSWNIYFLSLRGKETIIKAVLHALPVYAMQCFYSQRLYVLL